MTKIRKFVVPVDLTSEGPPEVEYAAEISRALGAEVILLHAIDYIPTLLPVELPGGYPLPQIELVREAATEKMNRIAAKMTQVNVRIVVESGTAATTIIDVAKREHADGIILGSHSRKALARMVLGSVADRVAHTATCPVTIVREMGK